MRHWFYPPTTPPLTVEAVQSFLELSFCRRIGGEVYQFECGDGSVLCEWCVYLPGTSVNPHEAKRLLKYPSHDFGFCIEFDKLDNDIYCISASRPKNPWEGWALEAVMHEMAKRLGAEEIWCASYGSTDLAEKPDPDARKASFYDYCARGYEKPMSSAEQETVQRQMQMAPIGYRGPRMD